MNGCLEREVGELEEERRRLKAHLKFSAKHQGQVALDTALSPEQLAAIDAFIAGLKSEDHQPSVGSCLKATGAVAPNLRLHDAMPSVSAKLQWARPSKPADTCGRF